MKTQFFARLVLSLAIAISGDGPAFAMVSMIPHRAPGIQGAGFLNWMLQDVQAAPGQGRGKTGDTSGNSGDYSPGTTKFNPLITGKISHDIAAAVNECGKYKDVYRIDCLRQNLDHLQRSLPSNGDYRKVKYILQKAVLRLGNVVTAYADPETPRMAPAPHANPRFLKRRSYSAVRKSKVGEAMRKARAIIQEAQTELLRSSENSALRLAHYQKIATAVGSTKVLLRSS